MPTRRYAPLNTCHCGVGTGQSEIKENYRITFTAPNRNMTSPVRACQRGLDHNVFTKHYRLSDQAKHCASRANIYLRL